MSFPLVAEYGVEAAILDCLVAGLADQAAAINAELAAAGKSLALPMPAQIASRMVMGQYPLHLVVPAVHVVSLDTAGSQAAGYTPGGQRLNGSLPVEVGIYLIAPSLVDGLDAEGALVASLHCYREAVRRCVMRSANEGGARGVAGIAQITMAAKRRALWQVETSSGAITGGLGVTQFLIQHKVTR